MLQSMTGFAAKECELTLDNATTVHATFMLKTLNGRYFEAHCKLPHALSTLETEILKKLKNEISRGSTYLTIYVSSGSSLQAEIKPSINVIKQYVQAIKTAQEQLPIKGEITVTELIRLPNVFETLEPLISEKAKEQIYTILDGLIKDLVKARIHEGAALKEDLEKRTKDIKKYLSDLEPRALVVMEEKKQEVLKLMAETQSQMPGSEINTATAFYSMLDKIDIHEEITRFNSLLEQLNGVLTTKEKEKGKRLDFTLQELFREINTITAKCSDAQISKLAINIKVELEKARELSQNVL